MRIPLNFIAGFMALAIACYPLLPHQPLVVFQSRELAKGYGLNHVAFWFVIAVGAVACIVKLVRHE